MKVFVSGSTGFVGANIARRFLSEGWEVHISVRRGANTWRLHDVLDQMQVHELDLLDYPALCSTMEKVRPHSIIHLATYGAYPRIQTDLDKIFETNMVGTLNLVRASDKVKYESFINTSSSSEYGLVKKYMAEGDLPAPVNYYGATKAGATIFCQVHTKITGAPIVTTRLFSVFGPFEESTRLVPSTIRKCLLNQELEFTSGLQKRDFIYTQDIEDAYLELVRRPELKGEVINIGTGRHYDVRSMVEAIIAETKTTSKPAWAKLATDESGDFYWVADTSKADRLLKWKPRHSLKEGVKKSVEWVRQNLQFYAEKGE